MKRSVFAIISGLMIAFWLLMTVITYISSVQSDRKNAVRTAVTGSGEYSEDDDGANGSPLNVLRSVRTVIRKSKDRLESRTKAKNIAYSYALDLQKIFDKYLYRYNMTTSLMGTLNDSEDSQDVVVRRRDGYLSMLTDSSDIEANYEKLRDFADEMKGEGRDLIFLIPCDNKGDLDPSYMGVYTDHTEEYRDRLVERCNEDGISVINISDYIQGMDHKELFFRGDHHWLPQTGLMACGILADRMDSMGYDIDTSLFDPDKYDIKYNTVPMIGSLTQKVSTVYSPTEWLPLLIPKYDADLDVSVSGLGIHESGRIEDTMFYRDRLKAGRKYEQFQYLSYGYGDQDLVEIHNNLRNDGSRVLIIKESFADCMVPYLSNIAEDLSVVDLRLFDGSVMSYIEEKDPDLILIVYAVGGFTHHTDKYRRAFEFD